MLSKSKIEVITCKQKLDKIKHHNLANLVENLNGIYKKKLDCKTNINGYETPNGYFYIE